MASECVVWQRKEMCCHMGVPTIPYYCNVNTALQNPGLMKLHAIFPTVPFLSLSLYICFWPKVNYGLLLSSNNSHVCVKFILPHWKHSCIYRIMKGVKSVPSSLSYQTSVFSTGILVIELCPYEFVKLDHKICCTDCNLSLMGMWTKY